MGRATTTAAVVLATTVAAGALVVGDALAPGRDGPAAASAAALPAFSSCQQLRRWYVAQTLPAVGPFGYGGGLIVPAMRAEAVGASATGTNVQEAGVDEADVAKTDGRLVVRLLAGRLVVTDVSGPRPVERSSTDLPGPGMQDAELLLDGDRVLVVGDQTPVVGGPPTLERSAPRPSGPSVTHLVALDLADPAHPRVTADRVVDGTVVSTRQYAGATARVVLTSGSPRLPFVVPGAALSPREATVRNRALVRRAPLSAWLPGIRAVGGPERPLLACGDVRHPHVGSGPGTITVLTFPVADPTAVRATAVTASGDLVYSSTDRLYVATTAGGSVLPVPGPASGSGPAVGRRSAPLRTQVHAFALAGDRTSYVASGTVPGTVRDRWSFSASGGHLRVVTSVGTGLDPTANDVVVLDEVGDRLRTVGRLDGLGRGEQVESVRWFGDLAVLVTFRRTDPLFTLDLADPRHPRVLGALRAPGFSAYLHPVGGDRLLGLGFDASADGVVSQAQAATFDLSDPRHVTRDATLPFGPGTDVSAALDPRTVAYLPEQRVLVTPVQSWSADRSWFVALHVGPDGALRQVQSWVTRRYAGTDVRALPLGGGRVALVGDVVRVVDVG